MGQVKWGWFWANGRGAEFFRGENRADLRLAIRFCLFVPFANFCEPLRVAGSRPDHRTTTKSRRSAAASGQGKPVSGRERRIPSNIACAKKFVTRS